MSHAPSTPLADHCLLIFRPNCGRCFYCTGGRPMLCVDHVTPLGTLYDRATRLSLNEQAVYHLARVACFAEYAVIPEAQLLPTTRSTRPTPRSKPGRSQEG